MISVINAYSTTTQTGDAAVFRTASKIEYTPETNSASTTSTPTGSTQTISILARQLAGSAARMDEQVQTLSRSQLADKARNIIDRIAGDSYYLNRAKHDSEVPNSDDPALLARAKQATAFINDASRGGHSVKNPFVGLSREQLANIIYDDSGTYTVNERHAAWRESYDQEEAWRERVCAQAMDEYNRTGKLTNFFREGLDHYRGLPVIEQAQYPNNYESDLESKIKLDFNYRTHRAESESETPMSLIEMLFDKGLKLSQHGDDSSLLGETGDQRAQP